MLKKKLYLSLILPFIVLILVSCIKEIGAPWETPNKSSFINIPATGDASHISYVVNNDNTINISCTNGYVQLAPTPAIKSYIPKYIRSPQTSLVETIWFKLDLTTNLKTIVLSSALINPNSQGYLWYREGSWNNTCTATSCNTYVTCIPSNKASIWTFNQPI